MGRRKKREVRIEVGHPLIYIDKKGIPRFSIIKRIRSNGRLDLVYVRVDYLAKRIGREHTIVAVRRSESDGERDCWIGE